MKFKTPLLAASVSFALLGDSQAVNVLVNPSFEDPVLTNVRVNNLGSVPTGWSQTLAPATWNMIRLDGAPYSSGPDNAADGFQILDINGISTIFQSFTVTTTFRHHLWGHHSVTVKPMISVQRQPWASTIQLV